MTPEPRQNAIQQLIRQRNPFHANPDLKLRRRGFQRLWHHPRLGRYRLRLARLVFNATERLTKYLILITTPFIGFVLAAALIILLLTIALYWLNFTLAELTLGQVMEQSWPNYTGWIVISSTLFCLPYWCWAFPLALTLRYYHALHRWYIRRRLQSQLQTTHRDHPAYLSAQIAQHPLMTGYVPPPPSVAHWLQVSGKIMGAITGTLAALLSLILSIKLVLLLWNLGEFWHLILVSISCPIGIYIPLLAFRSYRSGQAVADLILELLRGTRYKEAVIAALVKFWSEQLEDL